MKKPFIDPLGLKSAISAHQIKLAQESKSEFGWRAAHNCNRPYLTPSELAYLLQISTKTLYRWRVEGTGPKFVKIGKAVRYAFKDLDAWANRISLFQM